MSTSRARRRAEIYNNAEPLAESLRFDSENMYVNLKDGRILIVPLTRFPRLLGATPEQRVAFELDAIGEDIHWEAIDEDICVANLIKDPDQVLIYR